MTDTTWLDATAQAELVRSGAVSPIELVDAAIERVERVNPQLNAVIHPLFDAARETAKGDLPDGPFRGVPIVFKDLGCAVAGDPYHEGLAIAKRLGFRATRTDELARRYFDAGFVCIGRTNAPEMGLVPTTEPYAYGPTRNPWNLDRTTGGSSGGSAAAVASGMVPVAHANDGGGSIRIPASCCGLVGLKPSRGRVSGASFFDPLYSMLTVELCVSRSVRDTAAILDAVHGASIGDTVAAPCPARPYRDEVGADPGRLRVGILTHDPLSGATAKPECIAAVDDAGAPPRVARPPRGTELPEGARRSRARRSLHGAVGRWTRGRHRRVGDRARRADHRERRRAAHLGAHRDGARDHGRRVRDRARPRSVNKTRDVAQWWADGFDLLLTPTLAEPPVPLGTFDTPDEPILGFMRAAEFTPFTPGFNITGQPAISLPTATSSDGLPIGIHLAGAFGREDLLLRVAAQIEAAAPWADRHPPVHARESRRRAGLLRRHPRQRSTPSSPKASTISASRRSPS